MPSHVHLIYRAKDNNPGNLLCLGSCPHEPETIVNQLIKKSNIFETLFIKNVKSIYIFAFDFYG